MRARLMLLWLPLVIMAALSLPGAVLAVGYSYYVSTDTCEAPAHTAHLKVSAVWEAGSSADEIVLATYGQRFHGGRWRTIWVDSTYETISPNSPDQTWTDDHTMYARAQRVRLMWGVTFRQAGAVVWSKSLVSVAC